MRQIPRSAEVAKPSAINPPATAPEPVAKHHVLPRGKERP
jgi:hypothetical protein